MRIETVFQHCPGQFARSGIVACQIDYGSQNPIVKLPTGDGVPGVFYEVAVTERLKGESLNPIVVSGMDLQDLIISDQATLLRRGQQVLLCLEERMPEDAPGIAVVDHWYVVKILDFGILDLARAHNTLVPRMPQAFDNPELTVQEVGTKVQD